MELLLGGLVAFVLWKWYRQIKRVQFIQAAQFLYQLHKGTSVEEANGIALKLFTKDSQPLEDTLAERNALMFAAHNTLGKENPVILVARQQGFLG